MRFFAYTALSVSAFVASGVQAAHTLTLKNNCGFAVGLKLSNWPGHPAYTGPAIGTISSKGSKTVTVPNGWDGRICDAAGGCGNVQKCSMTEFNMDANGLNYYDISNIQAYTVPQKITSSCGSVTCGSATCPCDQAYGIGNMAGTCPGSSTPDRPVRACGEPNFTITYCP
ncbi:hypothetical protein RhiJN_16051 [Ceratobasidium sp. AG-Ba]|nr:hypothetical protein RhiJN_16051 [Ceratobasidium sp. AG-Ba]